MISWFKKHFIPHHSNNHRPHFLHTENARMTLCLIIALELLVFIIPSLTFVNRVENSDLASVLPTVLSTLTNEERVDNDVPELVENPLLTKAAQLKANDMAEKGYFAHTSPEGKTPWFWLDQVGYRYDYAGENLAINFVDSKDVTEAWMRSPTHRANIVKSAYKEVGTAIASGMYEGEETLFVVQVYANPLVAPVNVFAAAPQITAVSSVPVAPEAPTQTQTSNQTPKPSTQIVATAPEIPEVLGTEIAQNTAQTKPNLVRTPTTTSALPTTPETQSESVQKTVPISSGFEKIIASPRHSTNMIFLAILAVVLAALALNVFIKMKSFHPDLVNNGLFVVTVIIAILLINMFIGTKDIEAQSIDYSRIQVMVEGGEI